MLDDDGMEAVLSITCPNILFPYAREAISNFTVKAGFARNPGSHNHQISSGFLMEF